MYILVCMYILYYVLYVHIYIHMCVLYRDVGTLTPVRGRKVLDGAFYTEIC